jgi:hypothetical protein
MLKSLEKGYQVYSFNLDSLQKLIKHALKKINSNLAIILNPFSATPKSH